MKSFSENITARETVAQMISDSEATTRTELESVATIVDLLAQVVTGQQDTISALFTCHQVQAKLIKKLTFIVAGLIVGQAVLFWLFWFSIRG